MKQPIVRRVGIDGSYLDCPSCNNQKLCYVEVHGSKLCVKCAIDTEQILRLREEIFVWADSVCCWLDLDVDSVPPDPIAAHISEQGKSILRKICGIEGD